VRLILAQVRMAAELGCLVTPEVTNLARAHIMQTSPLSYDDPRARLLAAEALAAVHAEMLADYRRRYKAARRAGDVTEVRRWERALKDAHRMDPRAFALLDGGISPLPLVDLLPALHAEPPPAESLYEARAGHDPPPPLDAASTAPHRPCAPPTLLTRGREWLPRVGTVGTHLEGEGVIPLAA
jgi:hypothetical protein